MNNKNWGGKRIGAGRKRYTPTNEEQIFVKALLESEMHWTDIAKVLSISYHTFMRAFVVELAEAKYE